MYLEMLTNWLIPQLAAERHDYLLQQDGVPPRWHLAVRMFLNEHLPNRLAVLDKMTRCSASGPLRSPALTVCEIFLWGVHEGQSLCPSTTRNCG
jgi:hypothetical protein